LPKGIVVATDSQRIVDTVERFGGVARLTDPNAASGTDRVAEVAQAYPDIELFVNVQGDEPEIEGEIIDRVVDLLVQDETAGVATLATPISDPARVNDPGCVKVVMDHNGRALYFSRYGIPFVRDDAPVDLQHFQHLGIYAYRREFLLRLNQLPPSPLEESEKLEQLRFLQAGVGIRVGVVDHAAQGIDTIEDYRAFVSRQAKR
jgi:3-deoxy-manno-octulosonate cytidylyltransferase (CMP-KDO synthetase)